jgi:glucose/arabinose dehydrogenase
MQRPRRGFENSDGSYRGPPVDAVPGLDGALYMSDDAAGAICRLAPLAWKTRAGKRTQET